MCDVLQILTNNVVLCESNVGGDGLTSKEDGSIFVHGYEKPVHSLREGGREGGREGREGGREGGREVRERGR